MVLYYERPSGHIVEKPKTTNAEPSESDIYFDQQSKKQFDNICGYQNFGYSAETENKSIAKKGGQFYQKELYRFIATEFMDPV